MEKNQPRIIQINFESKIPVVWGLAEYIDTALSFWLQWTGNILMLPHPTKLVRFLVGALCCKFPCVSPDSQEWILLTTKSNAKRKTII